MENVAKLIIVSKKNKQNKQISYILKRKNIKMIFYLMQLINLDYYQNLFKFDQVLHYLICIKMD